MFSCDSSLEQLYTPPLLVAYFSYIVFELARRTVDHVAPTNIFELMRCLRWVTH